VVATVQDVAQCATDQADADVVQLSLADQKCFAHALLSPPATGPSLETSFRQSQRLRSD
jgi:hypothetical protein